MRQEFHDIFNRAIGKLRHGHSPAEAASDWPEHTPQLAPLLKTVQMLQNMPRKAVPMPAMQRKYITAPAKRAWVQWLHFSRFAAVSVSVVLLAALGVSSGYAAYTSKPGEIFFSLKKAAEHAQVDFATNPQDKINLQIALAQKRLNDAQAALNDSSDPQKQAAALSELADETQNTADVITQVTKSQPAAAVNTPIIASLDTIATQQQALLKTISKDKVASVDPKVINAAQASVTNVANIKQQLEIAGRDQALTALATNPNAITATGTITQITYNTISVDNQIYTLSGETIIKDASGAAINQSDLKLKESVQVLGDKNDGALTARQITVLDVQGKVKGAATDVPSTTSTPSSLKDGPTSTPVTENVTPPLPDPNTAVGSFIIEDPNPVCPTAGC